MKWYEGLHVRGAGVLYVGDSAGRRQLPMITHHPVRDYYSPYTWGYIGPAGTQWNMQLNTAYALLLDVFGDTDEGRELAERLHGRFASEIVSREGYVRLELRESAIRRWAEGVKAMGMRELGASTGTAGVCGEWPDTG